MQPERAPERVPHGYEFHDHAPSPASFLQGVIEGLSASRKAIPYRFLYDARGSNLFETICEQPEYYPTRTELRILERHAGEIADLIGPGAHLVELGSGAGRKVRLLLDALEAPASYTAIDISRDALISAVSGLSEDGRDLEIHAVWADYTTRFDLPASRNGRIVGFFPGSTIGNFERDEARAFLRAWAERLGPDAGFLVGVDLTKSVAVLERAYDDAAGATAAFSLNLLERANRELGADFDTRRFRHQARFEPSSGAVEINLVSLAEQDVSIAGRTFHFREGEQLHVENSHKYGVGAFADLARSAGFIWRCAWTDPQAFFSVHYLATPSALTPCPPIQAPEGKP